MGKKDCSFCTSWQERKDIEVSLWLNTILGGKEMQFMSFLKERKHYTLCCHGRKRGRN